eukprot:6480247-Amphidinium_carterae.1
MEPGLFHLVFIIASVHTASGKDRLCFGDDLPFEFDRQLPYMLVIPPISNRRMALRVNKLNEQCVYSMILQVSNSTSHSHVIVNELNVLCYISTKLQFYCEYFGQFCIQTHSLNLTE